MLNQITRSSPWRPPYALYAIVLAAMLSSPAGVRAAAEDLSASMFSFSGFGTLGLVHSSEDRADFVANPLQPSGAGYTRPWSPDVDSRLGVQVTAQFTPQLSAMLQVISEQNYDNTFTPHVEWADISYQPTPEFTVRVGRMVLPTFLLSDSRKVGYASPWVRPPVEVYDLSPVYDNDGVDTSYKMHLGGFVNTLVGSYGKNDFGVPPQGGTLDDNHQWAIADTVEYDALTLHVAYLRSSITYRTLDAVFDAFRQFGPQGTALANQYDLDNKLGQQITAGAIYDPGQWFLMGEWGRRILHSAIVDSTAWYLSGGYRLAKFTPYLTYAEVKADSNTSTPGLNVTTLPPYLAGPATSLNAALNEILATNPIQKTMSVGFRWDVMKDIDFKMQYDRIALGAGSAGTLANIQPGFQLGSIVNLFSVAIDFVW
jgi:Gram-negative porin